MLIRQGLEHSRKSVSPRWLFVRSSNQFPAEARIPKEILLKIWLEFVFIFETNPTDSVTQPEVTTNMQDYIHNLILNTRLHTHEKVNPVCIYNALILIALHYQK